MKFKRISLIILAGVVAAGKNSKYGFIDTKGEVVIPFEYDSVIMINEDGIGVVKKDGKYGIIQIAEK